MYGGHSNGIGALVLTLLGGATRAVRGIGQFVSEIAKAKH